MNKIIIHTDGGSRGNPGPSAAGVFIEYDGKTRGYSRHLGERTNNEAEYEAVILALKKIKFLIGKSGAKNRDIEIWVDSELLHRQVTGRYKVLDKKIQTLFLKVWNLKIDFGNLTFHHTLREGNKEADALVNRELNQGSLL